MNHRTNFPVIAWGNFMRVRSAISCLFATGLAASGLTGCTTPVRTIPGVARTLPVVVVSEGLGGVLRGSVRVEQTQGSYVVSKGKLSCSGSYALATWTPRLPVSILCNDGRKGTAYVTNDQDKFSGKGNFTLNDGTKGEFVFGNETKKY
ncbi:hypothetical protein [Labrys miyagiensis]|uniref:hypothetical protein n=1 Tax=Labrys miyagiensis TaxID=346912 RepID=UPI0024E16DC9|nr:hypothetical protein [Labrys miyagiensis]